MVYGDDPGQFTKVVSVPREAQDRFCLNDRQVLRLAEWVCHIERYYTKRRGEWTPMDIEWAVDGLSSTLFIVQARPETVQRNRDGNRLIEYAVTKPAPEKRVLTGIAVGDSIASGKVVVLHSLDGRDGSRDGVEFEAGNVLVTEMTDPDWEPIMKKASAIITNKGGRTCHAAIIARELGVPAIVGSVNATDLLRDGQLITASCCEGDVGYVYDGEVSYDRTETALDDLPKVDTPIMLNVASPELAFKFASIPHAGVGLAREEFIINNYIQVHPLALLKHRELGDKALSGQIKELIRGYENEEMSLSISYRTA